jgi:hypothetical protein
MRGSMTISTPLGPLSLLARVRHLLVAALCSAVAAATAGVALGQPAPTVAVAATAPRPIDLSRFEKDIVAFETADRAAPLPRDGILFVGSSIFRLWKDLGAHMAPLPVLNRAFGGSRTPEQLHFFDRVVLPYRPRIIVYYCGSNDVNAGETAEDIAWHYREFSERVRATLPGTRVYFASIIKAPMRWCRRIRRPSPTAAISTSMSRCRTSGASRGWNCTCRTSCTTCLQPTNGSRRRCGRSSSRRGAR